MSRQGREEAMDIVEVGFSLIPETLNYRVAASHILNQLLKGGFLTDKALVHADELKD